MYVWMDIYKKKLTGKPLSQKRPQFALQMELTLALLEQSMTVAYMSEICICQPPQCPSHRCSPV